MSNNNQKKIIGRAERIYISAIDAIIPAKIDTGADLSSIWASDIELVGSELNFKLFDSTSKYFTGKVIELPKSEYRLTRIANSFGQKELRYAVKLSIELAERKINATFTLSDRSAKLYPILIGCRLLKGKFIVDVSKGDVLYTEEQKKYAKLQADLKKITSLSKGA